jgi:hypothetical protein
MKKNRQYNTSPGDEFTSTAKKAKALCILYFVATQENVEFNFNGIVCVVSPTTNLDHLYRDYCNAHIMDWKEVGPDCVEEYSEEVSSKISTQKEEQQKIWDEESALRKREEQITRNVVMDKVKNVQIELKDEELWNKGLENNTDPYGKTIYEYAELWGRLMQVELNNGSTVKECADAMSSELDFMGITGFMYGAAVSILSSCWKYGEDLRKWHNKQYDHEGDGVVNPAILTINTDKA